MQQRISAQNRIFICIISVLLALGFLPIGGVLQPITAHAATELKANDADLEYIITSNNDFPLNITANGTYHIIGGGTEWQTATHGIVVDPNHDGLDDVTVILDNVKIRTTVITSAAMLVDGRITYNNDNVTTKATILLIGDNALDSSTPGATRAGLETMRGTQITIDADPSSPAAKLHAQSSGVLVGGVLSNGANANNGGGGAGIGAGDTTANSGGHIVIRGGDITAVASYHGSGIGDAWGSGRGASWVEANLYDGTILVYGGKLNLFPGFHGSGIGGACYVHHYSTYPVCTVVVVPDAKVTSNPITGGIYPTALGGAKNVVYIGDPNEQAINVSTSDARADVDMYISLLGEPLKPGASIPDSTYPPDPSKDTDTERKDKLAAIATVDKLRALGIGLDVFNPERIFFGTTNSLGQANTNGVFPQQVTFYTDATLNGYQYQPVTRAIPALSSPTVRDVVLNLEESMLKVEYINPADTTPWNEGYGTDLAEVAAKTGTVRVTNIGAYNADNIEFIKFGMENYDFINKNTNQPLDDTSISLAKLATFDILVKLKPGKTAGSYGGSVEAVCSKMSPDALGTIATFTQKVVSRPVTATVQAQNLVSGMFTATATFSQPVNALTASGVTIVNGTAGNFKSVPPLSIYATQWTFDVTPADNLAGNSKIGITINAGAVQDNHDKGNSVSAKKEVTYVKDTPTVTFGTGTGLINDNDILKTDTASIWFDIAANATGSNTEERTKITVDGTELASAVLTSADYIITKDGGAIIPAPTVSIVGTKVTLTGTFDDGNYKLTLNPGRFTNFNANTLGANVLNFQLRVPAIIPGTDYTTNPLNDEFGYGIGINPAQLSYIGGNAMLTIYGKNLQFAGENLKILIPAGVAGAGTYISPTTIAEDGASATYPVSLPRNSTNAVVPYAFKLYLNGAIANVNSTAIAKVKAATPNFDGIGHGLTVDPASMDYRGGTATLTLKGENLHNYTDLKIIIPELSNTTIPITVNQDGEITVVKTQFLPKNITTANQTYNFKLYDGVTLLSPSAQVVVGPATPNIESFTIREDEHSVQSLILEDGGGTVDFDIGGVNLQHFAPLGISNDNTLLPVVATNKGGAANDYDAAEAQMTFPPNKTQADIVYTMTLTTNGGATIHTVTVTVKKPSIGVTAINANPIKHETAGGNSHFEIQGKNMDVATLALKDTERGTVYPISLISNNGSNAEIDIVFPPHSGNLRNDLYKMEVYFDGQPTGILTTIEVGPSNPSLTGIVAVPSYFATVADTLGGKGKSLITVQGNYMFNFSSLQLYDPIYDRFYDVPNAGMDMEAYYTVSVPSATGVYDYTLYCDGQPTAYIAQIRVGVPLGQSDPSNTDTGYEEKNTSKSWDRRGGGAKGGGFTGRHYVGLDVLRYQAQVEANANPVNPSIVLSNIPFVSKSHFELVWAGGKVGAQASKIVGDGIMTVYFDTSRKNNETILEGRLSIKVDQPLPDILPGVYLDPVETAATRAMFASRFSNKNLLVICLDQDGDYGTTVEVAAGADLSGFNTKTLYFYRYDRISGKYAPLPNPQSFIDTEHFLHFKTDKGGDIIVTDQPLTENGKIAETGSFTVEKKKSDEQDSTGGVN